jgi:hypothetical protein
VLPQHDQCVPVPQLLQLPPQLPLPLQCVIPSGFPPQPFQEPQWGNSLGVTPAGTTGGGDDDDDDDDDDTNKDVVKYR